MLGYYDYTVVTTYASLFVSVLGIFRAWAGQPLAAIFCLMISGLFDAFDGEIARTKPSRSEEAKRFGIQIDSLCDLVCFGVLPAVICRCFGLTAWWFLPLGFAYILCAQIRLAYFNVQEEERQSKTNARRQFYAGLPVTSIALLLPPVYLLRNLSMDALRYGGAALLAVVAVLFISPLKIPKFHRAGIAAMAALGLAEAVLLLASR